MYTKVNALCHIETGKIQSLPYGTIVVPAFESEDGTVFELEAQALRYDAEMEARAGMRHAFKQELFCENTIDTDFSHDIIEQLIDDTEFGEEVFKQLSKLYGTK